MMCLTFPWKDFHVPLWINLSFHIHTWHGGVVWIYNILNKSKLSYSNTHHSLSKKWKRFQETMSPKAYCLEKIILLIWFLSLNLNTVDFKLSRTKNFHVCFISAQNMRKGLTILQAWGGRVFNIPSYCKSALKPSNMPLNTPKFQFFWCLGLRDPFYFAQTVSGGCNLRGGENNFV